MKKSNIFFVISMVFISSLAIFSCTKEDSVTDGFNTNQLNSLKYGENTYVLNDDKSVKKIENEEYKYDIILSESTGEGTYSVLRELEDQNEYVIRNEQTNEFVELVNIEKYDEYYTFDLINNLGDRYNNFTYYGELNQANQKCPPCVVGVVAIVAAAIVDLNTTSPLEDCTASMNNLNCAEGTSAYMNFEDGWFSTSCSTGCR